MTRLPTLFIPHGGGPCFFLKRGEMFPAGTWDRMANYLQSIPANIGGRPKALLVISAHWEEDVPTTYAPRRASLLYDYHGFPPSSYQLQYPAAGDPELAAWVRDLLWDADVTCADDSARGFDHGVFIPMKLIFPDAGIPIVQLSLKTGLEVDVHLAIGRALKPLRDNGVLIIGSGMSYHNLQALSQSAGDPGAREFDAWLNRAVTAPEAEARDLALAKWSRAPGGRTAHPREEHLAPLFVVAGAAGNDRGWRSYADVVFGKPVSGFQFGTVRPTSGAA